MKELQKEKISKANHFLFKLLFLIILGIALAVLVYEFLLIQPKSGLFAERKIVSVEPVKPAIIEVTQVAPVTTDCLNKLYLNDLIIVTKLKLAEYDQGDIAVFIKQTGSNELRKYLYKISSLPSISLKQMQQDFTEVSLKILAMNEQAAPPQNWFKRYIAKHIQIRKIDSRAIADGGVEGRIVEVKVALEQKNFQNASDVLSGFDEEQKKLLQPLLTQLQNQLVLEATVKEAYELVTSKKYQDNFNMVCSK